MSRLHALFLLVFAMPAFAFVKSVNPKKDQILVIKTAIGIATIVQVPDTIQSAIIGDQSGFKVEYIDKAVTIKPLRPGARTNLYLITAKERFNLTLVPSRQDQADYVVYIKSHQTLPSVKWTRFVRRAKSENLILKINRVGLSDIGILLIDANITASQPRRLRPEDFFLYQGKESRVINSLYLSRREVSPHSPVLMGISIAKADIDPYTLMKLTLKTEPGLSIDLPESLWKK